MKIIGIIPARLNSVRLPRKPLLKINDKTLIEVVYNNCKKSNLDDVIVACDSKEIYDEVIKFGGKAIISKKIHKNGTSRIAEAALELQADFIVNIQGDEPFFDVNSINEFIKHLDKKYPVYTVYTTKNFNVDDFNNVKVILNKNSEAIYFSRSRIPFNRNNYDSYNKHIGVYAYDYSFLQKYNNLKISKVENAESLEQIRILFHGYKIKCIEINGNFIGIDNQKDLEQARRRL